MAVATSSEANLIKLIKKCNFVTTPIRANPRTYGTTYLLKAITSMENDWRQKNVEEYFRVKGYLQQEAFTSHLKHYVKSETTSISTLL